MKVRVKFRENKYTFHNIHLSKTESRGRHVWQWLPTFPAIARLHFRLPACQNGTKSSHLKDLEKKEVEAKNDLETFKYAKQRS